MSQLNFLPWSSVPLSQATLHENLPAVLDNHKFRWASSRRDTQAFAAEHGSALRAHLATTGCVLLRGFPVDGAQDFESLLDGLQIPLGDSYEGGVSPRNAVTGRTFTSTDASGYFLITPHNEMCYLPQRPTCIAFYCEVEPQRYGETPIFNSRETARELPRDLTEKMQRLGVLYRRFTAKRPSYSNVEKTLNQTFGTDDRVKVQRILDKLQARSEWDEKGNLVFDVHMPAFVRHPQSGQDCMNLVIFNRYAHSLDTALFKDRWNPWKLFMINAVMGYVQSKPRAFMRTLWGDGTELSREETQTLLHTAWRHSVLFRWRKGDVLILDNILWGHGRMNVQGPRRILAALGHSYDVHAMTRPAVSMYGRASWSEAGPGGGNY
ncbi:TauD/TfdA family dioxygenase [Oligoflexus tunisiensis]|uniref:TauD/TfdA family dioxygenase n=1 Tax=Oligoflexus tunisiensis TaxID=708132 RepID=UPI00159F1D5E|nr:TauD/TfdA family dioxygenase [Oligoflexus tunisiensis]